MPSRSLNVLQKVITKLAVLQLVLWKALHAWNLDCSCHTVSHLWPRRARTVTIVHTEVGTNIVCRPSTAWSRRPRPWRRSVASAAGLQTGEQVRAPPAPPGLAGSSSMSPPRGKWQRVPSELRRGRLQPALGTGFISRADSDAVTFRRAVIECAVQSDAEWGAGLDRRRSSRSEYARLQRPLHACFGNKGPTMSQTVRYLIVWLCGETRVVSLGGCTVAEWETLDSTNSARGR